MDSILVLTHQEDCSADLTKTSLEAVTAGLELAEQLGAQLSIGAIAQDALKAVKVLVGTHARILSVSGDVFAQARYASDAAACEALCRAAQATIVLAPHSSRFARVMGGVSHRLGGCIDTHVSDMHTSTEGAAPTFEVTRWFYRQRIEAVLSRASRPWVLLLDAGTYAAWSATPGAVHAGEIAVEMPVQRTQVTGLRAPKQDEQTIRPEAKMLFVAGAGWTKKQPDGQIHLAEAADLILNFLHTSGASLGSSKSLVDQGSDGQPVLPFLTHLNQVGQTGSTPRHPKGLSTCCHGEEPHVVGWRFVRERRAISLDPNCGWARGKADVVYVADAFQVITRINEILRSSNRLP